jgi:hypothetical protein
MEVNWKIGKNTKMVLFIVGSFLLFSLSIAVNVYADANSDAIDQRNKIDQIKLDISAQKALIITIEDEEIYWEDQVELRNDRLEDLEKLAKTAKNNYEVRQQITIEDVDDINEIEALKVIWENAQDLVDTARTELGTGNNDLDTRTLKLSDAEAKLKELEDSLPIAEEYMIELIKLANQAVDSTSSRILISIILSDTCLASNDCPTYKQLADVYDNSNRDISGNFIQVDSGKTTSVYKFVECTGNCSTEGTTVKVGEEPLLVWKRDSPVYSTNTVGWYELSIIPVVTFVDPDDATRKKSKVIIIEPSLPAGFDKFNAMNNNTLTFGSDRKIDGCSSAIIGWNPHGEDLVADTWNFFYNNCAEESTIDTTITNYFTPTNFNECFTQCEYMKWIANAKESAKNYLLGEKELR